MSDRAEGLVYHTIGDPVATDLNGNIVYNLQVNAFAYRAYRMQDLYTLAHP